MGTVPGSGPAERSQRETPGQGHDRNKCTVQGLIEAREALRAALAAGLRGQFDQVTATRVWNEAEGPPLAALEESHLVKSQAAEEEPGFLELLAESEKAMPRLIEYITEMGRIINQMGELSRSATDELSKSDSAGGGAGGRSPSPFASQRPFRIEPLAWNCSQLTTRNR
jgi:hypothetical protein